MVKLLKTPSAWLPLAMSVTAILLIIIYVGINGVRVNQDERTAARIFQMLLIGQVPIVIYFASKWLPKSSKEATEIILLQATVALLSIVLILFLER